MKTFEISGRGSAEMDESYSFGGFRVSATRRELWADDRPVAIGARALDVLIALVRGRGQLVSKSELIDQVWTGAAVEDGAIAAQVAAVRRVLGCGVDGARYVQTVPGRGYRFVAPVATAAGPAAPTAEPASGAVTPGSGSLRRVRPALIAGAVALALVAGVLLWRPGAARVQPWSDQDTRLTFVIRPTRVAGDPSLAAYGDEFARALASRFNPALGDPRLAQNARYGVGLEFRRAGPRIVTRVTLRDQAKGQILGVGEVSDAPGRTPSFPTVWHASSIAKLTAGRRDAALALAKPAAQRDAHDLLIMAMNAPIDRAHSVEVLGWLDQAARLAPSQPLIGDYLATILDARTANGWSPNAGGELARVIAVAQGLLHDNPEDIYALQALTDSYVLQGRWEDVLVAADRLLALKPDDIVGLLAKGRAQLALGADLQLDATVARLLPFQQTNDERRIAQFAGLVRFHEGRYGEAAQFLRRAVQVTPEEDLARPAFGGLRLYLAAAEAQQGRLEVARTDLGDFLAAAPNVRRKADFWRWNDAVRFPLIDRPRLSAALARIGWGDAVSSAGRSPAPPSGA